MRTSITRRSRPQALWVVISAIALSAACGTTVPRDARLAGPSRAGTIDASDPEFATGGDANLPGDSGSLSGGNRANTVTSVTRPTGGTTPVGNAADSGSRTVRVASGTPGVTDREIRVGIPVFDTSATNAADRAQGATGERHEEAALTGRAMYDKVIAYVNNQGGLAGRKIVPVYADQDVLQYATPAGRQREQQRGCATFTEDQPVFAINGAGATEELWLDCAQRANTVFVANRVQVYPDRQRFQSIAKYWYSPHGLLAENREGGLAHELLAQGFFTPGAKVALMIENRPGIRAGVERGTKPVLSAAGVALGDLCPAVPVGWRDTHRHVRQYWWVGHKVHDAGL
jgi:hypothetical protein